MSTKIQKYKLPKELKHIELGKTLIKKHLFFEAFDHFKNSIEIHQNFGIEILIFLYKTPIDDKNTPLRNLIIAKVYFELQLWNEGFDVLEENIEDYPQHEQTYDTLAKLISKKQLRNKIKLCFENAINKNIFFASIINILPSIYLEEKNYNKAIHFYQEMIKMNSNEYSYYKILSELHFRKRDYEAASDILSELIKIAPFKSDELIQPIEQILKKIPRHSSVRILFANILFRAFKPDEGCQEIATLIKYHPNKKDDAIQLLREQNDAFPNHPEILCLIAELMIENESYTESLSFIEALITYSPIHSDRALLLMQKIIQLFPNHCLALEIIGNIYYQQENNLQALHYYNQCIDNMEEIHEVSFLDNLETIKNNDHSVAQNKANLIIAKIKSKSNQNEAAIAILNTLENTDIEIESELLYITILNENNSFSEAQNRLKKLTTKHRFQWNIHQVQKETFNKFINFQIKQIDQSEKSHTSLLQKASFLLAKGNYSDTIQLLQQIPESSHSFIESQQMIARGFFETSRYDLASQIYSRLIKVLSSHEKIKALHYWSGLSQLLLSNEEQALICFETVATFDQNYLNTLPITEQLRKQKFLNHNGLVAIGCKSGTDYQMLLRKNHFGPQKKKNHQFEVIGFSQSYNDEGCKQLIKQQYKAARESFELAIQMDPKFHIPHINIAFLNLIENRLSEAVKHITLAESITTNCPYTYFVKCLISIEKSDIEHGVRLIQQAIKLNSKESLFYIMLGDLFYHQFQLELATTYWNKSNEFQDLIHFEQQRCRIKNMDKINPEYWISPELLSLR